MKTDFPDCISDLLDTDEYDRGRFGSSSDDWLTDPDRMQRCHDAAEYGSDGSTHGEIIDDWRTIANDMARDRDVDNWDAFTMDDFAAWYAYRRLLNDIDDCEQWHINNGSIDDQCS